MSISAVMIQGLQLMLMGMGFVFIFLGLLVTLISVVSKVVIGMSPVERAPAATSTVSVLPDNVSSDPELVSVITSAVHHHRKQHSKRNT